MRYIVRKEGLSWIVRGSCGHYYAARRTHGDAIQWADTLATAPAKRRTDNAINRIRAAINRIEGRDHPRPATRADPPRHAMGERVKIAT